MAAPRRLRSRHGGVHRRRRKEFAIAADVFHPGVYIDELPVNAGTIVGVPTAVAAFAGRAARGSEEPVVVDSLAAFVRSFGAVDAAHPMAWAVRDFFANGGQQALVLRLFQPPAAAVDTAVLSRGRFRLAAASRGSWANTLRIRIDANVSAAVAAELGLAVGDLFNLTIADTAGGTTESFSNLTVKDSPRRADRVLAEGSALLRVASRLPTKLVPRSHAALPRAGKTVWTDSTTSTGVSATGRAADSAALDAAAWLGDGATSGLWALRRAEPFNLLCLPPDAFDADTPPAVLGSALDLCVERRAMLIVDAPAAWTSAGDIVARDHAALAALGLAGERARNAALYFPRILVADPASAGGQRCTVACGAVAGVYARTDGRRGVWKAPAGRDATLYGVDELAVDVGDLDHGLINPIGVNGLRRFPNTGPVVWGARTLRGDDALGDEYKYVPVRRLALFIEESLVRGLPWAVFEPNGEALWAQVRLRVDDFMQRLFRAGALAGSSAREAFFVQCGRDSTTQAELDAGLLRVEVGFAPLKPAEFVIVSVHMRTAQASG
jgi:uncharacterized protein